MGRKLTLTGVTIADPTAPTLITVDPIESAGSLFLVDPTHPASTMSSGVPINGQPVTNLLNARAKALTGVDVPGTWFVGAGFNGTKGRLERSGKGGFHSVPSPTLADGTVDAQIYATAGLEAYLRANPTHLFYMSIWKRITKAQSAGPTAGSRPGGSGQITRLASPTTNTLLILSSQDPYAAGVRRPSSLQAVGPFFQNAANNAWSASGTPPSAGDLVVRPLVLSPNAALNYTDAMRREQEGRIVYRAYLEDLTVSGRTYAQVDAIDYALYTKEVLTAGGRYYGDTWTDPTTLA